ncbi:hypothetical protein [Paucibacter sp. Y2R2-4]|uniref:hypothetical protein n=1 Tax=Paucibacter sp. Y2R2-4 TaxID=2893553 RepID=UPI0021E50386|nr:hypothetical protein [Paucibacter sp. Y2R2-4]MCV2351167.1 hypothetical protein [Paucibacter sp. Y2R2-4]
MLLTSLTHATRLRISGLLAAALLMGCAGPRQGKTAYAPQQDRAAAQQRAEALAAGGYSGAAQNSLTLSMQQWVVQGDHLPVSLAFPGSGQALPLLVYLPGLGESAQAGAHWRHAWARAGYAVLSLQALESDATAWSSPLARSAEFKALAQQHQAPELNAARLRVLQAALQEAQARARAGDSLWSRVNFENIAVAGYDLGSMTALAWADASMAPAMAKPRAQATPSSALPRPRALLLLSPLSEAACAGEALAAGRHPGLGLPLLAVSSRRDTDPTGLIDNPAQRISFFAHLPATGDKYLLLLNNSSHAALAGATGMEEAPSEPSRGQGSSGGRGSRNAGGQGNHRGGAPGGANMAPVAAPPLRDMGNQEAGVAIEHSSIAFLDAYLRGKPQAQGWLQDRPSVWLAGMAEWRLR